MKHVMPENIDLILLELKLMYEIDICLNFFLNIHCDTFISNSFL